MAKDSSQQQDEWTQGLSQFREAIEHNVTASRLIATGAVALGAAATAYFWDPSRRSAFLDSSRRLSEDMSSWWTGLGSSSSSKGDGGSSSTTGS
jgi:hypothetical protein